MAVAREALKDQVTAGWGPTEMSEGVAGWRFAHTKKTPRVRAALVGLLNELPFVCPVVVAVGSTVMIALKLCNNLPP